MQFYKKKSYSSVCLIQYIKINYKKNIMIVNDDDLNKIEDIKIAKKLNTQEY